VLVSSVSPAFFSYCQPPSPGQDPKDRILQRESAQARNLVDRIFAKDKNAKVFMYVGYGHLDKQPAASWASRWAA
jgi:hypothetical protein